MHFQTSLLPTWSRLRRGRTVKFNRVYICRTLSIKLCRPPKATVLDASSWLAATVCRFAREAQSQRMIACFWFQSTGMLCAHWWKIKGCGRQTEPCQKNILISVSPLPDEHVKFSLVRRRQSDVRVSALAMGGATCGCRSRALLIANTKNKSGFTVAFCLGRNRDTLPLNLNTEGWS